MSQAALKPALKHRGMENLRIVQNAGRDRKMNRSVLVADDEPLARRPLRTHLTQVGWTGENLEARDGQSAIAIANKHRPKRLFLDIVMPGATGLPILERLEYEPRVV